MRFLLLMILSLASMSSYADRLTIERLHGDPALSGPGVRDLKMSPDGARVTFLRGRDDDQFQLDLWEYNLQDKSMRRLLDSKIMVPEEKFPMPKRRAASVNALPLSTAFPITTGRRTASSCW